MRMTIVNHRVTTAENQQAPDLPAWKWLKDVLENLGKDGTSSDESEGELDEPGRVFTTKSMPWRRDLTKEIRILDTERMYDTTAFKARGSKPAPRVRRSNGPRSSRPAPCNLPRSFYDDDWLASLPVSEKNRLACLNDGSPAFAWLDLVADCR